MEFNDLVKLTDNEFLSYYDERIPDDVTYIDTGSYIINALYSGSIYKGIPSNKIVSYIGEPQTGKTFFTLSAVKSFLNSDKHNAVIYFESEGALQPNQSDTNELLDSFGIDKERFKILPVDTVQKFRHQITKVLDGYSDAVNNNKKMPKLLICLDSMGNLGTSKEFEDAAEGKEVQDMSRARLLKSTFRVITLKLAKLKIPMIITNHVYSQIGAMFPQQIPSGGQGLIYCSSIIVALSRRKEKDGTDVIGNIIHCKNFKNRLVKENKIVDTLLTYDSGLNRYYGLNTLAEKYGIFKRVGNRYELPDGTKAFEKQLNNESEKYYTKEILDLIDSAAAKEFLYGSDRIVEQQVEKKETKAKCKTQ